MLKNVCEQMSKLFHKRHYRPSTWTSAGKSEERIPESWVSLCSDAILPVNELAVIIFYEDTEYDWAELLMPIKAKSCLTEVGEQAMDC